MACKAFLLVKKNEYIHEYNYYVNFNFLNESSIYELQVLLY